MKAKSTRVAPFLATLLLAVIIGLGGCATPGAEQRPAPPTSSIRAVETNIKQVIAQVDGIGVLLRELIKPDQADLQHAYALFAANVARMDALAAELDAHSNRINASGKEYFAEWQKGADALAKSQSQDDGDRDRVGMDALFDRIPQANVGVGSALHAYMSYIIETQLYLARHLSPTGIVAIMPVVRKGIQGGDDFKEALTQVLSAMEQVSANITHLEGGAIPASPGQRKERD